MDSSQKSSEHSKKNLAVFISGYGSNLEIFLNHKSSFQSLFVVSSNPKAYGLTRAKQHGVESMILEKPIDWQDLNKSLEKRGIQTIFCAGFMKIIPAAFIEAWKGPIFNLHPSMLPKYKGLKAIERAYEARDDIGVSIHHVVPEVDGGAIVLQDRAVPASDFDHLSLDQIKERVHQKEHELVKVWIEKIASF